MGSVSSVNSSSSNALTKDVQYRVVKRVGRSENRRKDKPDTKGFLVPPTTSELFEAVVLRAQIFLQLITLLCLLVLPA